MEKVFITILVFCTIIPIGSYGQVYIIHDANGSEYQKDFSSVSNSTSTRQNLFPLSPSETYGFILLILIAGLANAGGLGGGPLLSPILIMVFNYSEEHAIELVYALVLGGSIGNFLSVVFRRDPKTQKPLIEYDLGIICMPLMLLGTSLGVVINRILAPLITLIGILGVTMFSLAKLYAKARKTYTEETKAKKGIQEDPALVFHDGSSQCGTLTGHIEDEVNRHNIDSSLKEILKQETTLFPIKKIGMSVILICSIMLLAVIRGTKNFQSLIGIPYCGPIYWAFLGVTATICCLILFINWKTLEYPLKIKEIHNITSTRDKFELSKNYIARLLALSLIAGILAGLLGIGGGMIMSPTLISIGVPARTLAATTGFFVVQTSFISMFQAYLYRDVPLSDLGFLFLVSIIGSYGVSAVLGWLVKKYKRPSLVLFTLVIVLTLSLLTTPIFEIVTNLHSFKLMLAFGSLC